MTVNGYKVLFRDGENFLKLVMTVAQFCEHTKTHSVVPHKRLNLMVYELYLNKAIMKNDVV